MFATINRYEITHESNDKLVINVNKNNVAKEVIILISAILFFGIALRNELNFISPGMMELGIGVMFIMAIYKIIIGIKLLIHGEEYTFNRINNTIEINHVVHSRLDELKKINIVEHSDSESAPQFEIILSIDGHNDIKFRKTTSGWRVKKLGTSISRISDVPFNFISQEEIQKQEDLFHQKKNLHAHIENFMDKYKDKDDAELIEISKVESGYANYAREAALRILNQRANN